MKYFKLGSCMEGFQRQLRVPLLLYDYRTPPPAPPLAAAAAPTAFHKASWHPRHTWWLMGSYKSGYRSPNIGKNNRSPT